MTTAVYDLVVDASNVPAVGIGVQIRLVGSNASPVTGFTGLGASVVVPVRVVTDAAGRWDAALVANSAISPPGTVYEVVPEIPGGDTSYLTVPVSGATVWARDVLSEPPQQIPSPLLDQHVAATYGRHLSSEIDTEEGPSVASVLAGLGDVVYWGRYTTPLTVAPGAWVTVGAFEDDFIANYYTDETVGPTFSFNHTSGALTVVRRRACTFYAQVNWAAVTSNCDVYAALRITPPAGTLIDDVVQPRSYTPAGRAGQTPVEWTDVMPAGSIVELRVQHTDSAPLDFTYMGFKARRLV